MQINIKRVYDPPKVSDGYRILIDRLWPRGTKKEALKYDIWEKNIAPSPALLRWFHENPQEHWEGFVSLYSKELENSASVKDFVEKIKSHDRITLLYASKDATHNHASVLRQFLQNHLH